MEETIEVAELKEVELDRGDSFIGLPICVIDRDSQEILEIDSIHFGEGVLWINVTQPES